MAVVEDVVCPLCGLCCDDLKVEAAGADLAPVETRCPLADGFFRRSGAGTGPRVGGEPATLEVALTAAAGHLSASRNALIGGLGADVEGVRASLSLAERIGASVDHAGSDGLFRNLAVLQRTGWSVTTFAEVRNRCDVLVVVGPDPRPRHPRFFERWVEPRPAYLPEGTRRRVFFLGGEPSGPVEGCDVTAIPAADLAGAVASLRSRLRGLPVEPALAEIAQALTAAKYGVVAWAAGMLDPSGADVLVEGLVRLVRAVDATTRCSGLPVGGADNANGANQVCTWRTGLPLRTSFAGGTLRHDPEALGWRRRMAECDAALWVSALGGEAPSERPRGPLILLAAPEAQAEADVVIPVGTPGIDHAGTVFRGDGVVALHAGALVSRGLPSVAEVLRGIETRLGAPC